MDAARVGAQVVEHAHRRVAGAAIAVEDDAQFLLCVRALGIQQRMQGLRRDLVAEPRFFVDVAVKLNLSQAFYLLPLSMWLLFSHFHFVYHLLVLVHWSRCSD